MNIREGLTALVEEALAEARRKGGVGSGTTARVLLEIPKREGQGDYATSVAMVLAGSENRPPRSIAETIVENINDAHGLLSGVEIAGPGFINLTVNPQRWKEILWVIKDQGRNFGRSQIGRGKRVLVEFVSANPTGPLHVGHGRWAAFGNALSNLMEKAAFEVDREFYMNDAGRQVRLLGESVYARYQQTAGHEIPDPENGYRGGYIGRLAEGIRSEDGDRWVNKPLADGLNRFVQYSVREMASMIREDLDGFGIAFDLWFSEKSLFESGAVRETLEELRGKGHLYSKDGAEWFRSSDFGDDKDRVIRKEDGEYTYLASDIAYHKEKLSRGYDLLIDIWGADHHGYAARMEACVQALGFPKSRLKILIGQLVSLLRDGRPVAMSKRAGDFVTLREVLQEVGKDAALFFFLMRRLDTHLEFDLDLAKRRSNENPVYYVQYAHARLCSVRRQAEEQGIPPDDPKPEDLNTLNEAEDLILLKRLAHYPDLVEESAGLLEPHRITFYLLDLAGILHNYYFKHRFISSDEARTRARLFLADGIRTVMANALGVLGISAPERM